MHGNPETYGMLSISGLPRRFRSLQRQLTLLCNYNFLAKLGLKKQCYFIG